MNWKTIPTHPAFEMTESGQVRRKDTQAIKKAYIATSGSLTYKFYSGHTACKNVAVSTLLASTFNTEKALQKRKTMPAPLARNCGTCAWQYSGKCSVKSPGSVCEVENDDKCGKWERIREKEVENEFADDSYENSFTVQFEGASMDWEGYALSV
ncbi:MAG: hypothetical protein ACOYOV_00175 [Bacteroidales bacterium]